ncbi:MAG TPA: right-handed parallel beta-helix repeat-containing protein, partial [Ilumatobacteraceae bacterium]|nr:right-handed parallel beta-helix repeat-containing protein [Ilumatobacteraceae bacterium]
MRVALGVALAVATNLAGAHAATFVVSTTADSGPGSLRQAIADANAAPGLDAISFAIPEAGVPRISLATELPTVSDPATIDGTTQLPGASVELDGDATSSAVGLSITGGGSTVRGLVIGGFDEAGILISGLGSNVVEGNLVGTNVSGTQGRSPLAYGIEVSSSPANRIGGTSPGSGNLVSGNLFGIFVHGSAAVGNVIEGNFVGTNLSGTAAVPNSSTGIWILGASATVVGGADPAAGNVIAGNGTDGVDIGGPGAVDTMVWGNFIGFGADLTTPLGNGEYGIYVYGSAGRTEIGGTVANLIAANGDAGVRLPAGTRNTVRANVILDNGGLGIDLGTSAGVTLNDAGDVDGGANGSQNFPVLDAGFAGGTQVSGTLDGAASKSFIIEVFGSSACDPSGYGEGAELLAVVNVSTDGSGHGEFTTTLSRTVDGSTERLTATATDSVGNTSEFSQCTTLLATTTTTSSSTTSSTSSSTTTTAGGGSSTTTTSVPETSTTSVTSTTTSTTAGGESSTTSSSVPGTSTTSVTFSTTSTTAGGGSSTTTTSVPETSTTSVTSTTTSTTAGG